MARQHLLIIDSSYYIPLLCLRTQYLLMNLGTLPVRQLAGRRPLSHCHWPLGRWIGTLHTILVPARLHHSARQT